MRTNEDVFMRKVNKIGEQVVYSDGGYGSTGNK